MSFSIFPPNFSGASLSAAGRRGLVPIPVAGENNSFLRGDGTWSDGLPLDVKGSVKATTTANITLSGAQTIDGVSVIAGDRVLVKDQTLGQNNGIYVAAAGAWSRSTDADTSAEVTSGMYCWVDQGTVNADSGWILTTADPIVLGTTVLTFTQFSGAGMIVAGANITKTGNTIAVNPVMTGLTSLTLTNGGAITDGGTGALTFAASGTNQSITLTPSGTGKVAMVSGSTNNIYVGRNSSATTFNLLSFNNAFTTTTAQGLSGGADNDLYYLVPATGKQRWMIAGTEKMQLSAAGNLLIGGLTVDSSNGAIQNTGSTFATGYGFGTDRSLRVGADAGEIGFEHSSGPQLGFYVGTTQRAYIKANGASNFNLVGLAGSTILYSAGTIALTLDASQDALFAPTNRVRITGTKVLSFGATSNATIGVSADTTAGDLVFTPSSTGAIAVSGAATYGATALFKVTATADQSNLYLAQFKARTTGPAQLDIFGAGGTANIGIWSVNGTMVLGSSNATSLTLSGGAAATLTGGAGNMTITSGTGNSRTMTLQTTTSGGVAATALTLNADQSTDAAGNLSTGGHVKVGGGTAAGVVNGMIMAGGTVTIAASGGGAVTFFTNQTTGFNANVAVNGASVSTSTALNTTAGTTAVSSLRIPSGVAPTSPVSGDMWYDGTNLKFRDGSTTRTITWT